MINKEEITRVIFSAIDEINLLLPKNQRLKKGIDVILSGGTEELDSLGIINLIVATEQRVEEELGISITLAGKWTISQKENPFRTIGTLIDYIFLLLKENSNG